MGPRHAHAGRAGADHEETRHRPRHHHQRDRTLQIRLESDEGTRLGPGPGNATPQPHDQSKKPRPSKHTLTPRTISVRAQRLIKSYETWRPRPYSDPAGNATIGWGHFLHKGPPRSDDFAKWGTLSRAEGEKFFLSDARAAAADVRSLVKVPLTQGQLDALTDFVFNFGAGALESSTLVRVLNAGHYGQVPAQLERWKYGTVNGVLTELPGLVRRRAADVAMFVHGKYPIR